MKRLKNTKITTLLYSLALAMTIQLLTPITTQAQCPMCRMSAESNLQNGGTDGRGLNKGILYMLATPYLVVAGIGYFWWKNRRKEEDAVTGAEESEMI